MGIYLLRHIRTVYNIEHRLSGQSEVPVLNGEKLILPMHPVRLDTVFCSPSRRCQDTLRLLGNSYDLSETEIHFDSNLLERNLGALEGMKREDAIAAFPQLFSNGKLRVDAVPPYGESIDDVVCRISTLLPCLKRFNHSNSNALVLAHNQVLKILTAMLCQIDITDQYWQTKKYENGVLYSITNTTKEGR